MDTISSTLHRQRRAGQLRRESFHCRGHYRGKPYVQANKAWRRHIERRGQKWIALSGETPS